MPTIEIFELEAPTGACPARAELEQFERDLAWLRILGAQVSRHTFEFDRAAFYADDGVRAVIEAQGMTALPLVVVDGSIWSAGAYPTRPELARALGLDRAADEDYAAGLLATGVALGLALARHDTAATEKAHAALRRLGLAGTTFAMTVRKLSASEVSRDPQVAEALDRLVAYGSLQEPGECHCAGGPSKDGTPGGA